MGGLRQICGVVAEQMEDAGGTVRLIVGEDGQGLPQCLFAKVRFTGIAGAIQSIQKGGHIKQPGAML